MSAAERIALDLIDAIERNVEPRSPPSYSMTATSTVLSRTKIFSIPR